MASKCFLYKLRVLRPLQLKSIATSYCVVGTAGVTFEQGPQYRVASYSNVYLQ